MAIPIEQMLTYVIDYTPTFNPIDEDIARTTICHCGRNCRYLGYRYRESYRCFYVCEHCNEATEF